MKYKVKILEVAMVAEHTVETDRPDEVKERALETARMFPSKLNFRLPKKGEDLIVQIEQIG